MLYLDTKTVLKHSTGKAAFWKKQLGVALVLAFIAFSLMLAGVRFDLAFLLDSGVVIGVVVLLWLLLSWLYSIGLAEQKDIDFLVRCVDDNLLLKRVMTDAVDEALVGLLIQVLSIERTRPSTRGLFQRDRIPQFSTFERLFDLAKKFELIPRDMKYD